MFVKVGVLHLNKFKASLLNICFVSILAEMGTVMKLCKVYDNNDYRQRIHFDQKSSLETSA